MTDPTANDAEMTRLMAEYDEACKAAHAEYDRLDGVAARASRAAAAKVWQDAADNDEAYRSSVAARTAARAALDARIAEIAASDLTVAVGSES